MIKYVFIIGRVAPQINVFQHTVGDYAEVHGHPLWRMVNFRLGPALVVCFCW